MNNLFDKNEFERWFNESLYTFASAERDGLEGDYSWACFKFQQSAELALKSLLRGFGKHPVGHSLLKLLDEIESLGINIDRTIKSSARILDANYIPPRYPDAYPAGSPHEYYDEESVEKSKKSAELIKKFVEEIVKKYA